MISNIKFIDDGELFNILGRAPAIAIHLLKDAVDDIADAVEAEAKIRAPYREFGSLKEHAVDRDDVEIGIVFPTAAGPRARIEGGAQLGGFQPVLPRTIGKGNIVARSSITLPSIPRHARWVHEGTGLYGPLKRLIYPRTAPFMVFHSLGQWWKLPSVKGQKPNPYLEEAFRDVEATYAPVRLQKLRAEIKLLT